MIFLVKSLRVFCDSSSPKKYWTQQGLPKIRAGDLWRTFLFGSLIFGSFFCCWMRFDLFWHHRGLMADGFCSLFFLNEIVVRLGSCPLLWLYGCDFFARCFCSGLSSGIPSLQTTCIPCEVLLYGSPTREAPKRNWSLWVWRIAGNKTMAMEWKVTWVFLLFQGIMTTRIITIPKTKIGHRKWWLGDYFPFGKAYF